MSVARSWWRQLTGHRCPDRRDGRCVFEVGHDGLHGAPAGFSYRWWR